jgi:hypothetical protein
MVVRGSMSDNEVMRRRRPRAIPFEYFRLFTFGSDQELMAAFGSLDEAERVWRSMHDEFLARWRLWGMPEAWWRFEPAVPDDLRRGPHAIITEGDARRWDAIERGRKRYLQSLGIDPRRPWHSTHPG